MAVSDTHRLAQYMPALHLTLTLDSIICLDIQCTSVGAMSRRHLRVEHSINYYPSMATAPMCNNMSSSTLHSLCEDCKQTHLGSFSIWALIVLLAALCMSILYHAKPVARQGLICRLMQLS